MQSGPFLPTPTNDTEAPNGFPRRVVSPHNHVARGPAPLPKRPKGRFLFGILLVAVCGFVGYQVWDTFFRYHAHGIVEGRVLQLAPPHDCFVRYVHVREGETVRQGQVLFTLECPELSQRRDQLTCEIKIAQATLEAEASKLRWQSAVTNNQSQKAVAEFYELSGKLLREQAQLDATRSDLDRCRPLLLARAISPREVEQLEINLRGQEENVQKLKEGLALMKSRAEQTTDLLGKETEARVRLEEAGADQLKPFLARIQALQSEMGSVLHRMEDIHVRAPANGTVVKLQRSAGEYCKTADPLVTILQEGTLQIVLYVRQDASAALAVDQDVSVTVEPYPEAVRCKVVRVGDRYEPAPNNIERHYAANERLLPVYLEPRPEASKWMALRVGEVVKLPQGPSFSLGRWHE